MTGTGGGSTGIVLLVLNFGARWCWGGWLGLSHASAALPSGKEANTGLDQHCDRTLNCFLLAPTYSVFIIVVSFGTISAIKTVRCYINPSVHEQMTDEFSLVRGAQIKTSFTICDPFSD
jgi:hypothetical protein